MWTNRQLFPPLSRQLIRAGATALCLIGATACQAIEQVPAEAISTVALAETIRETLTDPISGRTYDLFIYDPAPDNRSAKAVIYMTDANANFDTMVEALNDWLRNNQNNADSAVIVGIGYSDTTSIMQARGLDLTNTPSDVLLPQGFGGDAQFRRFLLEQAKPWVSANYNIDPARETLFGHSFGGLFAIRTLIETPDAFDAYIGASTSLWWGEKSLLRQELGALSERPNVQSRPRVLLTVGELEEISAIADARPELAVDAPPLLPGFAARAQITDAMQLKNRLTGIHGIPTKLIVIEGEGHMSVVPAAISKAIPFALAQD